MMPIGSERQLQDRIVELVKTLHLGYYHTHDSRRSPAGFPDLVIWGPGGVALRELKTAKGRLSSDQARVIAELSAAGADVAVWRPDDWAQIVHELRALAQRWTPPTAGASE